MFILRISLLLEQLKQLDGDGEDSSSTIVDVLVEDRSARLFFSFF